jgi:hypothetical protein
MKVGVNDRIFILCQDDNNDVYWILQRYCTEAEWEKERVGRIQDAGRGSGSCHMANSIAR